LAQAFGEVGLSFRRVAGAMVLSCTYATFTQVGSDSSTTASASSCSLASVAPPVVATRSPVRSSARPFIPRCAVQPGSPIEAYEPADSSWVSWAAAAGHPVQTHFQHVSQALQGATPQTLPQPFRAVNSRSAEVYSRSSGGGSASKRGVRQVPTNVSACIEYDERLQEELYLSQSLVFSTVAVLPLPRGRTTEDSAQQGLAASSSSSPIPSRTPSPQLAYDESLQERVYLSEQQRSPRSCAQQKSSCFTADATGQRSQASFSSVQLGVASDDHASLTLQLAPEYHDVPVKHTFIHFDQLEEAQGSPISRRVRRFRRSKSAPVVLASSSRTVENHLEKVHEAHLRGNCRPCAYFWYKEDGCRLTDRCKFCHQCPPGEIKRRKKEKKAKKKALKEVSAAQTGCAAAGGEGRRGDVL